MQEMTLDKVKRFVEQNKMIPENSMIIAGVSGGNDSMTMLHLLKSLQAGWNFRLRVVHVNHGIRGRGSRKGIRRDVEDICRQWEIPVQLVLL